MSFQGKIRNPDCVLCPLHESADYVCLMGSGPKKAKVMVVGEAPGEREDETHKAFVGKAGQVLTQLLEGIGLSRDEVYITNAAKCRPPRNRTPSRGEIKTCSSTYLARELEVVDPDWVLVLGNAALQAVARKSGIKKHRGKVFKVDGFRVFATYHPAYALRNPSVGPDLEADFARFSRLVKGEKSKIRTKVRVVKTRKQLRWLVRKIEEADVASFDLETQGLEEWVPDAHAVCIGFSWAEGEAAVVPLHHVSKPWKDFRKVLAELKGPLERRSLKLVAHNGKFDARWLAKYKIFVTLTNDTMLAGHVLDENRPKALEYYSQMMLGADPWKIDITDAYNMDLKRLCVYNGRDCDMTLRLYWKFKKQLLKEPRLGKVVSRIMIPSSNALVRTERIGLWVDNDRLRKRTRKVEKRLARIHRQMVEDHEMPADLNMRSPQQLGRWLYGDLDLDILETTNTGQPSTNESVLKRLSHEHGAPATLLRYRGEYKTYSTYFLPWAERQDPRTSRLHTNYKLYGTVTGRLSSEHPNLQNVPRDPFIRGILGAPPGWVFVEADYSQIELRVAAMLSREARMLRQFRDGVDIHLTTAVDITGLLPDEIDKETRKKAKAVNFGFLYDMGWKKFIEYARDKYDVEYSEKEARRVRERYFEGYPGLKPWHKRQRRLVNRYGYVVSPIGRVRHLPGVYSQDDDVRAEAERQAINSPVQSLASDFMLLSLVRLYDTLPQSVARIVGTVHDQLLFEFREDAVDELVPIVKEVMEDTAYIEDKFGLEVTVPLEVDIQVGQHWTEGEEWSH